MMLSTLKETYTELFNKADESIKKAFEITSRTSQAKQLAEFHQGQYAAYIESCSKVLDIMRILERSLDEESASIMSSVRI